MAYEDRYKEFEQYLASGEPGVEERARNWSMAIGLQDVDRLKPSEFLLEQAKANIEGKISSNEVGKRLEEYYQQKDVREKAEADGTFEADLRNRTLHIRWNEQLRQNNVSDVAKRQIDVLETPLSFSERLSLKEMAVIRLITSDSKISIAAITAKTGLSRRTVDRVIATLKDKGILIREGAKNNAT